MWPGWMSFSGTEIVNSGRLYAYANAYGLPVRCEPCWGLLYALGDDTYTDPVADDAPWYDPARPESARVLGFGGLDVIGFSSNPVARSPVELIDDGVAIGVLRRVQRDVALTVMVCALDECALAYAYEWLASALRGAQCPGGDCSGQELCMFACCPDDQAPPGYDWGEVELRRLYDVGLLDGPTQVEKAGVPAGINCGGGGGLLNTGGGGIVATVEFTMVAGKPHIFRPTVDPLAQWINLDDGVRIPGYSPDDVYARCVPAPPCLQDPNCPVPPVPPQPPVPVDPCYPNTPFDARRSYVNVRPQLMPLWSELVPVVEVRAGARAITRLTIRFHSNPAGLECWEVSDPCAACFDITVAYLPGGATLTIDGRVQRASVDCPGALGSSTSVPALYGPLGRTYTWPVFSCPTGICVEVLCADDMLYGARARVRMFPRGDMG